MIFEVSNVESFVKTSTISELGFSERIINGELLDGGITSSIVLPSLTSKGSGLSSS